MSLVKRNAVWLLISQGATWLMSITVLLVAPRQLGDGAFGRLSFAVVYVSFFELVALFGTGTFLMKTVARRPGAVGIYVFNTLLMKLVGTAMLVALALALAVALGYPRETLLLIAVYCLGMVFNVLNNALVGGLQGLQRMGQLARWEIVRAYVGGLGALGVLVAGGGLVGYALAFNLVGIIPLVVNFVSLRPTLRTSRQVRPDMWRDILRGGFPFFVMSALVALYGTIDIPILRALAGDETVGWYALAYRWVTMPVFVAVAVSTALFPALSALSLEPGGEFTRMANRSLHLVSLVAMPAAVGVALVASDFIELLYGGEFQESAIVMQILAIHIPIVVLDVVLGSAIMAADRQHLWLRVAITAAIINPLVNLAAIPITDELFGNAAIGAAIVTVLTELILLDGALILRPRGVLDRPTSVVLAKTLAASGTMVPVIVLLGTQPLAVQIVAGATVYALASLLLKTISIGEIRGWVRTTPAAPSHEPSVTL